MTTTVIGGRKAPCKGCPDRYPACSDHCRKPEYLEWREELEQTRRNREKFNELRDIRW